VRRIHVLFLKVQRGPHGGGGGGKRGQRFSSLSNVGKGTEAGLASPTTLKKKRVLSLCGEGRKKKRGATVISRRVDGSKRKTYFITILLVASGEEEGKRRKHQKKAVIAMLRLQRPIKRGKKKKGNERFVVCRAGGKKWSSLSRPGGRKKKATWFLRLPLFLVKGNCGPSTLFVSAPCERRQMFNEGRKGRRPSPSTSAPAEEEV